MFFSYCSLLVVVKKELLSLVEEKTIQLKVKPVKNREFDAKIQLFYFLFSPGNIINQR